MGDSVEDLLAQLKAQYGDASADNPPSPPLPSQSTPSQSTPSQPTSPPSRLESADSIDDLLNNLDGTSTPSSRSSPPPLPPLSSPPIYPADHSPHRESFHQPPYYSSYSSNPSSITPDPLLEQLKAKYEEHDRAKELKRQEQLQQEQRRQEELKRQRRVLVLKQAEDWLKKLDPRSGEAVWFEEFAAKYESKLDAAIDYLGLLEEP